MKLDPAFASRVAGVEIYSGYLFDDDNPYGLIVSQEEKIAFFDSRNGDVKLYLAVDLENAPMYRPISRFATKRLNDWIRFVGFLLKEDLMDEEPAGLLLDMLYLELGSRGETNNG